MKFDKKIINIICVILLLIIIIGTLIFPWWSFNIKYYNSEVFQGETTISYGILFEVREDYLIDKDLHGNQIESLNKDTKFMPNIVYLSSHSDEYTDSDYEIYLLFACIQMLMVINLLFCIILFYFSIKSSERKTHYMVTLFSAILMLILNVTAVVSLYLFWPAGWIKSFSGTYTWPLQELPNKEIWGPNIGWYFPIIGSILLTIILYKIMKNHALLKSSAFENNHSNNKNADE